MVKEMENIDKKKLANEKRLKAIKEWQKNRNQVTQKISFQTSDLSFSKSENQNRVIYNSDDVSEDKKTHLKLFDSDDEEENFDDCFKIRPQFEGKNGQRMLELNSELSERFKLDERFQEKEVEITEEKEDPEKDKNIRILESILGHEVSKKHPVDVMSRKKRELKRFDPEDENTANCVKANDNAPKKRRKKEKNEELPTSEEIPYSSERYIEVSSDLKNIINSATPFSFSEKFNTNEENKDITYNDYENMESDYTNSLFEKKLQSVTDDSKVNDEAISIQKADFESRDTFKDPFFISSTDDRLKDGINFFMRPKPLDEIREEWQRKREEVLEIFRIKRKSALRGLVKRPKKQNQKRPFPFKM